MRRFITLSADNSIRQNSNITYNLSGTAFEERANDQSDQTKALHDWFKYFMVDHLHFELDNSSLFLRICMF